MEHGMVMVVGFGAALVAGAWSVRDWRNGERADSVLLMVAAALAAFGAFAELGGWK